MPIEFHCEHCGKFIRAADEHGGNHGKCPSCHQSVYIPNAEIEPIPFATLDEIEERRAYEQEQEAKRLRQSLLQESERTPYVAGEGAAPEPPNLQEQIVAYCLAMAEGQLERAERLSAEIRRHPGAAGPAVQSMVADELPPAGLEQLPRPVLLGFLKQLQD